MNLVFLGLMNLNRGGSIPTAAPDQAGLVVDLAAPNSPAAKPVTKTPLPERAARRPSIVAARRPSPATITAPAPLPVLPAAPSPAISSSGPGPTGETQAQARRALRALSACSPETLADAPADARARCAHGFLAGARAMEGRAISGYAVMDGGARLGFDAAAAAQDARRAARTGPLDRPFVECTGIGSNFGLGCLPPLTPATGKPQ